MRFEFLVEQATFLSIANAYLLDGRLLRGELRHNAKAFAQTSRGLVEVLVKTVAFVDGPAVDLGKRTLSIEPVCVPIEILVGTVLVGEAGPPDHSHVSLPS